jgi:uncharacterized protein RhaS with RHS repeats
MPPGPHALSSLASNQPGVTNRVYSYDANGNMQEIDGLRCTWDFMDRLVQVEDQSMRAEYRYDFTGRRIYQKGLVEERRAVANDSTNHKTGCPRTDASIGRLA